MKAPSSPEPRIEELSRLCIEGVRQLLNFELDLTIDTLPVLDHYARYQRTGPDWPDRAEDLALELGAYFGEVIRRRFPSRWYLSSDGAHSWRLEFEPFFLCFNPMGIAVEMLLEGEALGWNAAYLTWTEATEALRARLAKLPEVSEDDYYTFSVRSEVLEAVCDFLAGWTAKEPPRVFEGQFYQEQLDAQSKPEIVLSFQ